MAEKVQANSNNTLQIITPDKQPAIVKQWSNDLMSLTKSQNFELTPKECEYGTSIIYGLVDKCTKEKIPTNQLNMTNFLEQVKHFSRMQLSLQEKEIFIDVRNNKNTGLKDVTITKQYQGIQKIMVKYSTKKIVRFMEGVVCKGEEFEYIDDFTTGLTTITKHKKNELADRNKFINIEKAYAIAFVEEYGKVVPYTKIVDKSRLTTAYNASPSYDKSVWNNHGQRMSIKTAYWCLYNDVMKPYIELPANMQQSFIATEDTMDWENTSTQPTINQDIVYDISIDDEIIDNTIIDNVQIKEPITEVADTKEAVVESEPKPTQKVSNDKPFENKSEDYEKIYYVTYPYYQEHKEALVKAGEYNQETKRLPVKKLKPKG